IAEAIFHRNECRCIGADRVWRDGLSAAFRLGAVTVGARARTHIHRSPKAGALRFSPGRDGSGKPIRTVECASKEVPRYAGGDSREGATGGRFEGLDRPDNN